MLYLTYINLENIGFSTAKRGSRFQYARKANRTPLPTNNGTPDRLNALEQLLIN